MRHEAVAREVLSLRSRTFPALLALAALAAAAPRAASAHAVRAEVDRRGGAVAIRALHDGDRPLAGARWEARSPRGGDAPFAAGETDRHGWLAFTPDVPGTWTVRIADATGHGKTVEVEVAAAPAAAASAAAPAPEVALGISPQGAARRDPEPAREAGSGQALRVVAGVTAIVLVFRLLLAIQRARRGKVG